MTFQGLYNIDKNNIDIENIDLDVENGDLKLNLGLLY